MLAVYLLVLDVASALLQVCAIQLARVLAPKLTLSVYLLVLDVAPGVCQSPHKSATIKVALVTESACNTCVSALSWGLLSQALLQTCFMNDLAERSCAQRPDDMPMADALLLYFRYLCGALQKEQDTCLAKVLGLYQVCLLSTASSYSLVLYQILIAINK